MIQLRILSGKMAGNLFVARRFPFRIGRVAGNDLALDDAGVWDEHLALERIESDGFYAKAAPSAFMAVNEQSQPSARLRNGDVISFGSVKLQFWIAPPRQRALRFRELSVWLLIGGITILQVFLIYWLVK